MSLKTTVFLKVCLLGVFLAWPCRAIAEDEEPVQGLVIESKTGECSADYYLAREEGGNPDEAEDKKRTRVGMGETVTLTLTGKQALIGRDEDIRWSLEDGRQLGGFRGITDGKKKVTLEISNELNPDMVQYNNTIKVRAYSASTGQMPDKPFKIQVFLPARITAKHKRKEGGGRGVIAAAQKFPGFPTDGNADRGKPGASAQLELTIHPTDVSFKRIRVIEKDADARDKTFPPLGGRHFPGEEWSEISNGNRIIDTIGWKKALAFVQQHLSAEEPEQKWEWVCKRYVQSLLHQDLFMLNQVTQQFKVRWVDLLTRNAVYVWISKFGCQVERDSRQGTHAFSPQDNK